MTDETDDQIRTDDADSGVSDDKKRQAEIIATSGPDNDPDVFLVDYPHVDEPKYEPATPKNVALFRDGVYETLDGESEFETSDGQTVRLVGDVPNDVYHIEVNGVRARVATNAVETVVTAVQDPERSTGDVLHDVYFDVIDGQARRDVIETFIGNGLPLDRIESRPDGWVLDDTFLVTYEGENFFVDNDTVYIRKGGEMVQADESRQAVDLDFNTSASRQMELPTGETVSLTETEQVFLATVQSLLFPKKYFGVNLAEGVEDAKSSTAVSELDEMAQQSTVTGFTDPKTRNHHEHGFNKHRAISEVVAGELDNTLGMTEEAVEKLHFSDFDHASPHELLARKQEFQNAPFDIFEGDVPNDHSRRWTAIERAKGKAPIAQETQRQIEEMYGS